MFIWKKNWTLKSSSAQNNVIALGKTNGHQSIAQAITLNFKTVMIEWDYKTTIDFILDQSNQIC